MKCKNYSMHFSPFLIVMWNRKTNWKSNFLTTNRKVFKILYFILRNEMLTMKRHNSSRLENTLVPAQRNPKHHRLKRWQIWLHTIFERWVCFSAETAFLQLEMCGYKGRSLATFTQRSIFCMPYTRSFVGLFVVCVCFCLYVCSSNTYPISCGIPGNYMNQIRRIYGIPPVQRVRI